MLIDIHAHIIPYIDDGADDWEESLELLTQGEKEGITAVVATPHILSENDYLIEKEIISKFLELKQKAKAQHLKMKLYLGSEIYVQPDMTLNHKISTINNTEKYFLVEFPMNNIPRFVADKFFNFIVDEKIPIIAHPERNIGFQNNPILAYEFVQRGALMQINANSLLGKHGDRAKSLAFKLISNDLAHIIASDCHNPNHRSMSLIESYKIVEKNWGKYIAKLLFFVNPQYVIKGQKIESWEPQPVGDESQKSLFKKLIFFKNKR